MRARARDLMIMNIRQVRESGPGGSVGERIGLSNQQDGSRGLPTAAHWPGSRARYRIIARARRYDTADLCAPAIDRASGHSLINVGRPPRMKIGTARRA